MCDYVVRSLDSNQYQCQPLLLRFVPMLGAKEHILYMV
jgi:hypothetical protein